VLKETSVMVHMLHMFRYEDPVMRVGGTWWHMRYVVNLVYFECERSILCSWSTGYYIIPCFLRLVASLDWNVDYSILNSTTEDCLYFMQNKSQSTSNVKKRIR